MQLNYVAHSEIGLVRKNNQDSGYASPSMLVVADGMGGAAAGDLASAVAIDLLRHVDATHDTQKPHSEQLLEAVQAANNKISALVNDDPRLYSMGTTVCGGMFDGKTFSLIHIGDSRGYLVREGEVKRLTHDHTWVQSLVDEGKITAEEALIHPHRSLLLKVVNGNTSNTYDQDEFELQVGDRLLFCSDGLCGLVEDEDIYETLKGEDLEKVLQKLVNQAHAAGGHDNITIVLADVVPNDAPAPKNPLLLGAVIDVEIPTPQDQTESKQTPEEAEQAEEAARYQPIEAPKKFHWRRWLVSFLVIAAAMTGSAIWVSKTINSRFYLGVNSEDTVTVYRGIPDKFGPIAFSKQHEETNIKITDLPKHYADQVHAHEFRDISQNDIANTVAELDQISSQCITQRMARISNSDSDSEQSDNTENSADTEGC